MVKLGNISKLTSGRRFIVKLLDEREATSGSLKPNVRYSAVVKSWSPSYNEKKASALLIDGTNGVATFPF